MKYLGKKQRGGIYVHDGISRINLQYCYFKVKHCILLFIFEDNSESHSV
jgi:hypothetical protein